MGLLGLIIGAIGGFAFGRRKNQQSIIKNLDDAVLIISGIVVLLSIVFSALGKINGQIATVVLNVFGTMIFSWILTKKSAKYEFQEHEQEIASKSYRHINYIESAANTACKIIEESIESANSEEMKLTFARALDSIKYIQGGVNTCKFDWCDMMSEQEQKKLKDEDYNDTLKNRQDQEEYGVVRSNITGSPINQEDV